jgi:serine/threonine protein phosphatase PrpC
VAGRVNTADGDPAPLRLRWSARSEVGLVREGNEDSGYAGTRLLAVADGMGGMVAGDVASNLTVGVLRRLDDAVADDVVAALRVAILGANERLRVAVGVDPSLEGMGTTVTALLWDGTILGLAHIGDSRGYLLRDGRLERLTHDHTFVQSLVDDGRLTEAEARVHPHRSLLLRALDGRSEVDLDVAKLEMVEGDRFLLCSDGLCGYVDDEAIAVALTRPGRDEAVDALVELALLAGGVDNVTCLVADAVREGSPSDEIGDHGLAGTVSPGPGGGSGGGSVGAVLIGAAAVPAAVSPEVAEALADEVPLATGRPGRRTTAGATPADSGRVTGRGRAGRRRRAVAAGAIGEGGADDDLADEDGAAAARDGGDGDGGDGDGDPAGGSLGRGSRQPADPEEIRYALLDPRRSRWIGRIALLVLALAIIAAGIQQGWAWSQRQYYVGARNGHVVIYRGISENLLGISLSSVYSTDAALSVTDLPPYYQQRVQSSLSAGNLADARDVVATLQAIADHCRVVATDQQCRGNAPLQSTPSPVPIPTGSTAAPTPNPSTTAPTAPTTPAPLRSSAKPKATATTRKTPVHPPKSSRKPAA